jgi:methionyl-tRNA formyltransferase
MRIVFFGITQFATSGLKKLIERGTPPVALVVAPISAQDIENMKLIAKEHQIPVIEPADVNAPDFIASMIALKPDVLVTFTFDKKLGPELLNLTPHAYNMHPALLPDYRGNNPYFWVLANGEKETGVTLQVLAEKFDMGDIVLQERVPLHPHDTCGMVVHRQEAIAASLLDQLLGLIESGQPIPRTPQTEGTFKKAPKATLQDHFIHWGWPSYKILDRIRAVNPFSGAYTQYKQDVLSIYQAKSVAFDSPDHPGTVALLTEDGPLIKTGDGGIVLEVVMVGKKYLLTGNDFTEYEKVSIGDKMTSWE